MWRAVKQTLSAICRAFAHDRGLGQTVIYHHLTDLDFDPASQNATPTYSSVSTWAVVGPALGAGFGPGGESNWFIVARADLGFTPWPGDKITWSGEDYRVVKVTTDRAEAAYKLEVEPA